MMNRYNSVSNSVSKKLMSGYSKSFSLNSLLFSPKVRFHIQNIYGLVRTADEIVDTDRDNDALKILNTFEEETYSAIDDQFSTNPVIHSFAITARLYGIDAGLLNPFFESMRADLTITKSLTKKQFEKYIFGSSEVIGLMCLKVFIKNNESKYNDLASGAKKLGAAYQKINFLRDLEYDYRVLDRFYFPETSYETLTKSDLTSITTEVHLELIDTKKYILLLPWNSKIAVLISYYLHKFRLRQVKNELIRTITI